MAGGKYDTFKTPRQLTKINGEILIERTIRLLKENGITDIAISSNDPRFDGFGVPRLEHENNFEFKDGKTIKGHWVDAFYPTDEPTTYLYGDVYYSEECIKTIINTPTNRILFFASNIPNRKDYFKNWEEPYAFKVVNQKKFRKCIEVCKEKADNGETKREPISWELYRVINGININKHIIGKGFVAINDISVDIDREEDIKQLENIIKGVDK